MKERLLYLLQENRLMRNDIEFEIFDATLDSISELVDESDIVSLVSVLDDGTEEHEVMFRLVHLIESNVSSEKSFSFLLEGINCILDYAPKWSRILMYRMLNDEYSCKKINKLLDKVDSEIYDNIHKLLIDISNEDSKLFKDKIDIIIGKQQG